jgi:Mlc titration factor MtfA (ptsG expression regulator)
MNNPVSLIIFIIVTIAVIIVLRSSRKKRALLDKKLTEAFPEVWKAMLEKKVIFYSELSEEDKRLFENRIQRFIATKSMEGIDTDIDDDIRLMVASSAVIPTFAFPDYNYPHVQTILVYPNSFDEQFQTKRYEGHREFISGMVGNRSLNGTVILSKPDLVAAFDGLPHKGNVGIHEFVHLLDKEDGEIDGIPEALITRPFIGPWLIEIKKEMQKIENGNSDINPYALTNNAEFLAVVSEYFFDNPAKFKSRHSELYTFLSTIFKTAQGPQTPQSPTSKG